jgi:hypothetical protein
MNNSDAIVLAYKLSSGNALGVDVFVDFAEEDAPRIVFESKATGRHSLDVIVSSEARVLAHFDGFLMEQPGAPKAEPARTAHVDDESCVCRHCDPVAGEAQSVKSYTVMVEGEYTYNDGWAKSRVTMVGFIGVRAISVRTAKGAARASAELVEWECDDFEGKVKFLRCIDVVEDGTPVAGEGS